MKLANPACQWRLESNLGMLEEIATVEAGTQGLEAPDEFFVELSVYEKTNPSPRPEDIVFETFQGKSMCGVTSPCLCQLVCMITLAASDVHLQLL